jgi:hypothetical protein
VKDIFGNILWIAIRLKNISVANMEMGFANVKKS